MGWMDICKAIMYKLPSHEQVFVYWKNLYSCDTDTYCNIHAHTHIRLHSTQYDAARRQFTSLRVRNTRTQIIHSHFQSHTFEQICNGFYHYWLIVIGLNRTYKTIQNKLTTQYCVCVCVVVCVLGEGEREERRKSLPLSDISQRMFRESHNNSSWQTQYRIMGDDFSHCAIFWHVNNPQCLEFIAFTRWSVEAWYRSLRPISQKYSKTNMK